MEPRADRHDFPHDAFISYSRRDIDFARVLEKTLEAYSPPKDLGLPQRRLDVFRDEGDITGVDYGKAIERHLTKLPQTACCLLAPCTGEHVCGRRDSSFRSAPWRRPYHPYPALRYPQQRG